MSGPLDRTLAISSGATASDGVDWAGVSPPRGSTKWEGDASSVSRGSRSTWFSDAGAFGRIITTPGGVITTPGGVITTLGGC